MVHTQPLSDAFIDQPDWMKWLNVPGGVIMKLNFPKFDNHWIGEILYESCTYKNGMAGPNFDAIEKQVVDCFVVKRYKMKMYISTCMGVCLNFIAKTIVEIGWRLY